MRDSPGNDERLWATLSSLAAEFKGMKGQISYLMDENKRLTDENVEMKGHISRLTDENKCLTDENVEMRGQISYLMDENKRLKSEFSVLHSRVVTLEQDAFLLTIGHLVQKWFNEPRARNEDARDHCSLPQAQYDALRGLVERRNALAHRDGLPIFDEEFRRHFNRLSDIEQAAIRAIGVLEPH